MTRIVSLQKRSKEDRCKEPEEERTGTQSVALAQITFSSFLPPSMRQAVEELFFFNERQHLWIKEIKETIAETGPPRLTEENGRIAITLPLQEAQCLFACSSAFLPIGVALFNRPATDYFAVQFVATDPAWIVADSASVSLTGVLLEQIRSIACRVNGVTRIRLPYRSRLFLNVTRELFPKPLPKATYIPASPSE